MEAGRVHRPGLGAEAEAEPVVAVVRAGRGGEDVLDGAADVGEVGGAEAADVGQEAGGGEAVPERDGGACGGGGAPCSSEAENVGAGAQSAMTALPWNIGMQT
ncbi:hypothetical protein GCM10010305_11000 [Streptomyces termitum]|uniref:Uncharacterized protein n=1 Tax=Streptomyces termitum TaxID=67368 RepID=A0A918SW44_9ACTN|nr:hypothetical protein GCM10010305_11000 [Streptomyces termitum]